MTRTFESIGFKGGIWRGLLQADQPHARIALTHLGQIVALAQAQPEGASQWQISVAIPPETLSDGVQTYLLVADEGQGDEALHPGALRLGQLSVMAGVALDQDLQAEIALLKAEIELLKREFRRMATMQSPSP